MELGWYLCCSHSYSESPKRARHYHAHRHTCSYGVDDSSPILLKFQRRGDFGIDAMVIIFLFDLEETCINNLPTKCLAGGRH